MGDRTNKLLTPTLGIPNAFTTGDGQAHWKARTKCKLLSVTAAIETLGGSSGNTSIMLRNDTDTVDLLSSAVTIAYNADPQISEATLTSTVAYLEIDDGDVLEVDIDGVCGGAAEAGLSVYLELVGM